MTHHLLTLLSPAVNATVQEDHILLEDGGKFQTEDGGNLLEETSP